MHGNGLLQTNRRLAQHLLAHAHLHYRQPMISLNQFVLGLCTQLTVLAKTFVHQTRQQITFLFEHLLTLTQKLRLTPNLQERTLGWRYRQALAHAPVVSRPLCQVVSCASVTRISAAGGSIESKSQPRFKVSCTDRSSSSP